MPEMRFNVEWPDGTKESCYSPSLVIKDYLSVGETYAVPDFLARSQAALTIASDRVKARYGHACSLALGQKAAIEAACSRFGQDPAARVTVQSFHE